MINKIEKGMKKIYWIEIHSFYRFYRSVIHGLMTCYQWTGSLIETKKRHKLDINIPVKASLDD